MSIYSPSLEEFNLKKKRIQKANKKIQQTNPNDL